jgi:hypothetical protein
MIDGIFSHASAIESWVRYVWLPLNRGDDGFHSTKLGRRHVSRMQHDQLRQLYTILNPNIVKEPGIVDYFEGSMTVPRW